MSDPATQFNPSQLRAPVPIPKPLSTRPLLPMGVPAPDLGSIGPYRLIRKLGEGGMGQVWLAEQSAPVKRQVALKIIKAGRYDDSALLRFDVERQTLAIMDHPAIAKVFDAGSTARRSALLCDGVCAGLSHHYILRPKAPLGRESG